MAKFKKGDRVIRTTPGLGKDDSTVGQIGTILNADGTPWVEFDTPTTYSFAKHGGTPGYCDCVSEDQLELYHDEPRVPKPHDSNDFCVDAEREAAARAELPGHAVHAPAHYQRGGIETIRFIAAKLGPEGFKSYCIGNVYKYLSRHEDKGGKEDLEKAGVYLNWATNGLPEG